MSIKFEDPFDERRVQHFFDYEYVDRGIVKWQGYFLSDHTSALKQLHRKIQEVAQTHLEQQKIPIIQQKLVTAMQLNLPVLVQCNQINEASGQLLVVVGMVNSVGTTDCQIDEQICELLDVRGVLIAEENKKGPDSKLES